MKAQLIAVLSFFTVLALADVPSKHGYQYPGNQNPALDSHPESTDTTPQNDNPYPENQPQTQPEPTNPPPPSTSQKIPPNMDKNPAPTAP